MHETKAVLSFDFSYFSQAVDLGKMEMKRLPFCTQELGHPQPSRCVWFASSCAIQLSDGVSIVAY